MPADSTETRNRILSEALFHFAEHGFDGASMRAIASRSGISLALVQYHYGTKEKLYRAVWEEMTAPNSERRRAELSAFDATLPRAEALRELTMIFAKPLLAATTTERGRAFLAVVCRESFDPKEAERGVILDFADNDAQLLIEAFAKVLPGAARPEIVQTYLWMAFAFFQIVAGEARLRRLSAPDTVELTTAERLSSMVTFVVGGWMTLASGMENNRRRRAPGPSR